MENLSANIIPQSDSAVTREQVATYVQGASAKLKEMASGLTEARPSKLGFWSGVVAAGLGAVLGGVAMQKKISVTKRWFAGGGAVGAGYVATRLFQGQFEGEKQLKAMSSEILSFVDRFDRDNALQTEFLDFALRSVSASDLAQSTELKSFYPVGLLCRFGFEKNLLPHNNAFAMTLSMTGASINSIQSVILAKAADNNSAAMLR